MPFEFGHLPTGTTTNQDFLDILEGMLTAHPAWQYIEEHDGHRIWRCLGTENDFGEDFHVSMKIATFTTLMRFHSFENWNPATKGLSRPTVRGSSVHTVGADGSLQNGAEFTSGVYYFEGTQHFKPTLWVPENGGLQYWLSVTQNRIIGATRRDSDNALTNVYIGHFESFIPDHPSEHPLVSIEPRQTNTSLTSYLVGGWSRHPSREDTAIRENLAVYPMISGVASDWTKTEGQIGGSVDPFHGVPVGSRMLTRPLSSAFTTYGHLRGLYYNILDISVVAGVEAGDTVTIGPTGSEEQWVYLGANGNWVNADA